MLEKLKITPEDEAALRHLFEHKVFGQYFISQISRTGLGGALEFMPERDTMDMQTFVHRDTDGHYTQVGVEPAWWAFKEAAMHTSAFGLQVMVEHAKAWGWPKPHPWAAGNAGARACTCFPDEARPERCQHKYALGECRAAAGLPDLFPPGGNAGMPGTFNDQPEQS